MSSRPHAGERRLLVNLEASEAAVGFEYTWVQLSGIEKHLPVTASVAGPSLRGTFAVPVERGSLRGARCLVFRAIYESGGQAFGLLTAKHFRPAVPGTRGRAVKRISILASAPLAWVELECVQSDRGTEGGRDAPGEWWRRDREAEEEAERLVFSIYTNLNRYAYCTVTASGSGDLAEGESLAAELTGETLAALGAPLAFKALHEQSRLTLERTRSREEGSARGEDDGPSTIPDPTRAAWGTCVLWQRRDNAARPFRFTSNDSTELPAPSTDRWLRVTATRSGLEITGRGGPGEALSEHFVQAPYWAVVLAAQCCGALTRWSHELDSISRGLRAIDSPTDDDAEDRICQRCGFAYRADPSVCEPTARRTRAVSQIDELLLGGICTSLCAKVAFGGDRSPRGSYCLNHRRAYAASAEERRERELYGENRPRPFAGGGREGGRDDGKSQGEKRSRREGEGDGGEEDPDPGWWTWQRRFRQEVRERRLGRPDHELGRDGAWVRFWKTFYQSSASAGGRDGVPERPSVSADYWKGRSCRALGYHVRTVPFG